MCYFQLKKLDEVLTLKTEKANLFAYENENSESFLTESLCPTIFKDVVNFIPSIYTLNKT